MADAELELCLLSFKLLLGSRCHPALLRTLSSLSTSLTGCQKWKFVRTVTFTLDFGLLLWTLRRCPGSLSPSTGAGGAKEEKKFLARRSSGRWRRGILPLRGSIFSRYSGEDWLSEGPLWFHFLVFQFWIDFHFLGRDEGGNHFKTVPVF